MKHRYQTQRLHPSASWLVSGRPLENTLSFWKDRNMHSSMSRAMDGRIPRRRSRDVPFRIHRTLHIARRRAGYALCRALENERRPDVAEGGQCASRGSGWPSWLRVGGCLQAHIQARDRIFTGSCSTEGGHFLELELVTSGVSFLLWWSKCAQVEPTDQLIAQKLRDYGEVYSARFTSQVAVLPEMPRQVDTNAGRHGRPDPDRSDAVLRIRGAPTARSAHA